MGKQFTLIMILVIMDLVLVVSGLSCVGVEDGLCNNGSILFNFIFNYKDIGISELFKQLFTENFTGDALKSNLGIVALITGTAVVAGLLGQKSDAIIFLPIGATLMFLASDFRNIFESAQVPLLLKSFIFIPLTVAFVIAGYEAIRGKD